MIERVSGPIVARTVALVSKLSPEGYTERMEREGDWRVLLTKVADRDHNIHSLDLDKVSVEFQTRQIRETKEIYLPLFYRMLERCPAEVQPGIRRIIEDMVAEIARLETLN
jgi:(p)ppGpp synthase/HD superfamily hydrolase